MQIPVAPLPQAFGSDAGHPQVAFAQAWPAGHTLPQTPQLFASVVSVAQ